jgi:hypothetical protein
MDGDYSRFEKARKKINPFKPLTKAEGRRQRAEGRFCNGDLCPAPKTFPLKRGGFRPDFFDNSPQQVSHRNLESF